MNKATSALGRVGFLLWIRMPFWDTRKPLESLWRREGFWPVLFLHSLLCHARNIPPLLPTLPKTLSLTTSGAGRAGEPGLLLPWDLSVLCRNPVGPARVVALPYRVGRAVLTVDDVDPLVPLRAPAFGGPLG